jgi:hypothetical protein
MLSADRIDWLTAQYVWAIQNDAVIANRLNEAVRHMNFGQFRRQCGNGINWVKATLFREDDHGDTFDEDDRTFVVLTLWDQAGGNVWNKSSDHDFYVGRAKRLGVPYRGLEEPDADWLTADDPNAGDNPCHEIELQQLSQCVLETEKEIIMPNQSIAFETTSYIYGQDVNVLTEEQLIASIKKVEKEIASLSEVKTESKKVASKIAALKAQLASIVAVLDAR